MKFFSVDWLAQSHYQERAVVHAHRPHVPCVVQPRAPTFGKSYLQAKPKAWKPPQRAEDRGDQEDRSSLSSSPCPEVGGDSSGYESEAACSEGVSVDEVPEDQDESPRRARTKFSPEQIRGLERVFSRHRYLDAGERVKTAHRLDLTETQVRTWFQNRRMKLKREVQDFLTPQIPAVRLQPLHPPSGCTGPRPPYLLPGVPQLLLQIPPPQLFLQQHHQPHFC